MRYKLEADRAQLRLLRSCLVTTGLISFDNCVVYERLARSVPGFALITAPVLTFLFTGRDAAITMNIQCTLGVALK